MCIHFTIFKARKQLEDIVPVWAVLDLTHANTIERELLLIKISSIPPGTIAEEAGSDETNMKNVNHGYMMILDSY